jgi:hypothetical protein
MITEHQVDEINTLLTARKLAKERLALIYASNFSICIGKSICLKSGSCRETEVVMRTLIEHYEDFLRNNGRKLEDFGVTVSAVPTQKPKKWWTDPDSASLSLRGGQRA